MLYKEIEIQKLIGSIKSAHTIDYAPIARNLFNAGYSDIRTTASEIFDKTEKYIEKWLSRAEEEKDQNYAWGVRAVCTSAKTKLDEIKEDFSSPSFLTPFLHEKFKKEMTEIISSSSSLSLSSSEQIAESLLRAGFGNRFVFLSSFFEKMKKELKTNMENTKGQINDSKDDDQYVVGKVFMIRKFEEKIQKWEKEIEKEKEEGEKENE